MTEFNRFSPEWLAVRAYATARVSELTLSLLERQPYDAMVEKQVRIEELQELIGKFDPPEIAQPDEIEITFGY